MLRGSQHRASSATIRRLPSARGAVCPPGAKVACTPPPLRSFSKTKNIFVIYYLMSTHAHQNGGKRPPACCATVSATSRHLSHRRALSLCSGATLSLLFSHLLSCRPLLSSPPLTPSSSPPLLLSSFVLQETMPQQSASRRARCHVNARPRRARVRRAPSRSPHSYGRHALRRARTAQRGVVRKNR